MRNLDIGVRLLIGFGILVILTLLIGLLGYLGSRSATANIDSTGDVRVPTALASSRAQADLLRMLGDVRGYLALGEDSFRDSYNNARQAFEGDLAELERLSQLSPAFNEESKQNLAELDATFKEWSQWPERLFNLRDDRLEREEAYRILVTDGSQFAGSVLIDLQTMIEAQALREPTTANLELMKDMANFQGSFAAMLSGLRGYVTTQNRVFRGEYQANFDLNNIAWEKLTRSRDLFTPAQQEKLDNIVKNREAFLKLPDRMFKIVESDRYREDLYLFRTETIPLTDKMQTLLDEMTHDQQTLLQDELRRGRGGLAIANRQTLVGGIIAVILGLGLTFIFRENIAGPIVRLTEVAEKIRAGNLETQARIESGDEIGTLAETFNNMTGQLRGTLLQVRKEKKRADDLLHVVIPIGVELSAEKDFNRLLENMLIEAKAFCHANGGILYLRDAQEDNLKYVIIRNNAKGIALGGTTGKEIDLPPLPLYQENGEPNHQNVVTHVALKGDTVNIPHTGEAEEFDFSEAENDSKQINYQDATSLLSIPLKNSQDDVLGVLQLLDAQDPETAAIIPFDQNLQQMMESFSALAAAALEAYIREQGLRREIQQLRIEIDEVKRQQEVKEIVETDFFQDLQTKADTIRKRRQRRPRSTDQSSDS